MLRTAKVHHKSSELYPILSMHFGKSMNLARIKAMSLMICALCKVQRVAYTRLASAFDTGALSGSCVRRIQRLIAECMVDTDIIARLILKLIPVEGQYNLAMDKRGNSNTEERIAIVNRFRRIAGPDSISHLMADREFVGDEWLGYLNACGIHYHIRIRENFHITRHSRDSKAFWLFNDVRLGESKHLDGIYYVNGQACYLSGSKVKDKEGKPELQILVSYCNAEEALVSPAAEI